MSNQPPYDPQGGQPGGQNYPQGQPGYGAPQGQPGYGAPQGQPGHGAPQGGGYPGAPQGGYGSAPQMPGGGMGAPVDAAKPKSIDLAQKLMYVGAALSLLGLLLGLLMSGSVKDQLRETNPEFTEDQINTAATGGMIFAAIIGLLGVGLWLWMAKTNGDGKSWARIVATVLGALNIVSFLASFAQTVPTLSRVASAISVLLAIAILVLLWKPESTQYYNAKSARPV